MSERQAERDRIVRRALCRLLGCEGRWHTPAMPDGMPGALVRREACWRCGR